MANYGNFNFKRKRKNKKIIAIIVCVAAVLAAVILYLGIVYGGGSMENTSSAVAENTRLKLEIGELNDKIDKMQSVIDDLNASLEARPTVAPTPYAVAQSPQPSPSATAVPNEPTSPRGTAR